MFGCIDAESSFMLMVDMQERLLPVIDGHDAVCRNSVRLLSAARELDVPVIVTEQYPKGIGPTVPELAGLIPEGAPVLPKTAFSCLGAEGFEDALKDSAGRTAGRNTVIIFGIETHICVLTTVMDLVSMGMNVVLIADACGSRTRANHELGIAAARDFGALAVPAETAVYQMLQRAGTPQFKALLPLFKD